jgi:hypothetical protein
MNYDNWFEDSEEDDCLLPSVSDEEISGLGDSYDDGRIDVLTRAYIELRFEMQQLQK